MISDEPDEDADSLDDDTLLMAFLDGPQAADRATAASAPQDWPPRNRCMEALVVDADILAWFKTNHQDWQRQIGCVLRGWIVWHSRTDRSGQAGGTSRDQQPADGSSILMS